MVVVVVVQSLSSVRLFVTPWTAARQVSPSFHNGREFEQALGDGKGQGRLASCSSWARKESDMTEQLNNMSTESVMPSNHLILCRPLLLLPLIFPRIRISSSEWVLCIRWPKYWNFSISPSNEYSGLISFRISFRNSLRSPSLP